MTFTGADSGCTHAGGIVTCNASDMAAGDQITLDINTTITTSDAVVATVDVTANEADYPASVLNNNTASQTTMATATGDADPNDSDNGPSTQNPPPFIQVGTPAPAAPSSNGGGAVGIIDLVVTLMGIVVVTRRRPAIGRHNPRGT